VSALRLLVVFVCLLAAAPARADDRPWAAGVTPENQQAALPLFEAGNALFTDSQYAAALVRYREALKLWDHPAIRYNAAVSLINLDQPLPALAHLESALAHGEAPLGPENYRQALLYKKLLAAQVAELEVSCAEPNAEVMLDGETLFRGPGHVVRRLRPGTHQLTARKPGFLTETRALDLPAGRLTREALKLQAIGALPMREVRRWPVWQPWAVVGGGALLGLAGLPFLLEADSNFETFDAEVARVCPTGCTEAELPPAAGDARDRAEVQNAVAVTLFAVGGATAATGIVLVILNQPRLEPDRARTKVSVVPQVTPKSAGIAASLAF
jgi:tetratricopeptide (TPR) repeat protein